MPRTSSPRRHVRPTHRRIAVLTASLVTLPMAVTLALGTSGTSAYAGPADADNPCSRVRPDPDGVKVLATEDGQVLTGTDQRDVLDADGHLDVTIDGLGGNDNICGGPGEDVLNGGAGDDWIQGGAADDVIHGDDGHDYLFGNAGNDHLFGDADPDSLVVGNGPWGDATGPSQDVDVAVGGEGSNYLAIDARLAKSAPMTIDAGAGTATVPRGMSVTFSGIDSYYGPGRRATFLGTPADETVAGVSLALMKGGNDTVDIGPGEVAYGGPGDDDFGIYNGGAAHGGRGNDRANLEFQGYATDPDQTRFSGGAGDDRFSIESFIDDTRTWVPNAADARFGGGAGADAIDLKRLQFPVHADLGEQVARWVNSRLRWSHVESFRGSARADRIRGTRGPDRIMGSDGSDVTYGLRGRDVLIGGRQHDVVWGGPGRDVCHAEVRHLCEER